MSMLRFLLLVPAETIHTIYYADKLGSASEVFEAK